MLAWSLRKVGAHFPLLVLCSDHVSLRSVRLLEKHHIACRFLKDHIAVDLSIVNTDAGYDHWNRTFDKLFVWTLTDYDTVVYLDSDMQVIRNIDYLFDYPHMSAVRADEWNEPGLDKLNSGLIVIKPNMEDFEGMKRLWESGAINLRHVGDQDIIRAYFKDWGQHPELTLAPGLNVFYSEVSAGVISESNVSPVSVIHYIGPRKPWMVSPRAIWRRSRNNFLGKQLLRYAFILFLYRCVLI